jgi:hypothetical protein
MNKQAVIQDLKRAVATAANDDRSSPTSPARQRHVDRIMAVTSAIEFLESLPEEENGHA